MTLTTPFGALSDGQGIYGISITCQWLINPPAESDNTVFLQLVFLDTDEVDALTVYDGTDTTGTLLGTFSNQLQAPITVNGTSGSLFVTFTSDSYSAYVLIA